MDNRSIIKEWLRDSAVGFLLLVGGMVVAGALAREFQARAGVGYLCLLIISEIPFVYFLGLRKGFFRWWEYAGFFACIISMAVARDWLLQHGANKTLVAVLAPCMIFGCFISLHHAVRCHLNISLRDGGAEDSARH